MLSNYAPKALLEVMKSTGIAIKIGPFSANVRSNIGELPHALQTLYKDYPPNSSAFSDFHVNLSAPVGLRRWLRPQVYFSMDGQVPFKPLPREQAGPLFEWGLNWCVSSHAHQYLVVHAAAVEKLGLALLLPGQPGAGKSTLCAALVSRGWRLLTDELTLLPLRNQLLDAAGWPQQGSSLPQRVTAMPRPISLKNASIDIMRDFSPEQYFSQVTRDTVKGSVAHMRAPSSSIEAMAQPAIARWIVFPRYQAQAVTRLSAREKSKTCLELAQQSFNLNILGNAGFSLIEALLNQCDCFDFCYSKLDEAVAMFESLVADTLSADTHPSDVQPADV